MVGLIDAIIAKFTSAGLASTITGGMYYQQVASGVAFPYAVITVITAPLTDAYGNLISSDVTVQFALFGEGMRTSAVLMASLMAAYDNTLLSISGATNSGMWRNGDAVPMLQPQGDTAQKDQNSKDVWGHYVEYVYQVK